MKRKIWAAVILVIIIILSGLASVLLLGGPETNTVIIIQDGRELYRLDLDKAEDQLLEIEYNGKINTIEIKGHKIRMADADCPDHTCVNMGWLDSAPIICLPNRLVIQFENALDADGD